MAPPRKSAKKTSTAKKASSTKKKTSAAKAATAGSSSKKKTTTRKRTSSAKAADASKSSKSRSTSTKASAKAPAKKAPAKKAPAKATSSRASKKTAAVVDSPEVAFVRGLADIVQSYNIDELEYDTPDLTVTIRRSRQDGSVEQAVLAGAVPVAQGHQVMAAPVAGQNMAAQPVLIPSPAPSTPPSPGTFLERSGLESEEEQHVIKSPFVGTFYRRPSPDTEPYVTLGTRVSSGQVLCIVEAMKLMNEIEADRSGIIADILVEDAQPVEYGQQLFKIVPS